MWFHIHGISVSFQWKCMRAAGAYNLNLFADTRQFKKSVALGIGLMILQELSGCFTMLSYSAIIFDKSGSLKEPQESVLTVGIIQLIGTYLAVYVIQRVSRRRLLSISFIGTSLSLICFGIFSLLYELKYDVGPFSWTTVASFSSMVFAASFGIQPLPSIMLTEIIPKRVSPFPALIQYRFLIWCSNFLGFELWFHHLLVFCLDNLLHINKISGILYKYVWTIFMSIWICNLQLSRILICSVHSSGENGNGAYRWRIRSRWQFTNFWNILMEPFVISPFCFVRFIWK